jgi:hypothetical protein
MEVAVAGRTNTLPSGPGVIPAATENILGVLALQEAPHVVEDQCILITLANHHPSWVLNHPR